MTLWQYVSTSFHDLPLWANIAALSIYIVSSFIVLCVSKKEYFKYFSARLFLLIYLSILFASTVFFRPRSEERTYDFKPFWSYQAIGPERPDLIFEIITNVLLFIPIGFALAGATKKKIWWLPIVFGVMLSFAIESLQFLFRRGFSEVDDIMHNTFGCITGYVLYIILSCICRYSMRLCK